MGKQNRFLYLWITCCLLLCIALCYGTYTYFFATKDSSEIAKLGGSASGASSSEKGLQKPTRSGDQLMSSISKQSVKLPAQKTGQISDLDMSKQKFKASDELVVLPDGEGEVVMTESQVKALHKKQQAEAEAVLQSDAIVIPASDGEGAGMTVRQLQALHEKQETEYAKQLDDMLIPLSEDEGGVAMTVRQLKALHEEQLKEEAFSNQYEIAAVSSNENDPAMTNWELKALLQSQEDEFNATADLQEIEVAPAQDGQGPTVLTVQELKNLHAQQEKEAQITSK